MLSLKSLLPLVACSAFLVAANRADAGNMLLEIQQGGFAASMTNPANAEGSPTFVGITGVTVGDFLVTFVGGSSNSPGDSFNAFLNTSSLTITRLTNNSAAPLIIRVLADDFTNPIGNTLFLGSSASATFTGLSDDDSLSFTSFFDATNSRTFASGESSAPVTIVSGGTLTDGNGATAPTIQVANPNGIFSLSSVATINLLDVGSTIVTTGSTEVRDADFGGPGTGVVPEPASLALLAMGGFGLIGAGYRRRRASA